MAYKEQKVAIFGPVCNAPDPQRRSLRFTGPIFRQRMAVFWLVAEAQSIVLPNFWKVDEDEFFGVW